MVVVREPLPQTPTAPTRTASGVMVPTSAVMKPSPPLLDDAKVPSDRPIPADLDALALLTTVTDPLRARIDAAAAKARPPQWHLPSLPLDPGPPARTAGGSSCQGLRH